MCTVDKNAKWPKPVCIRCVTVWPIECAYVCVYSSRNRSASAWLWEGRQMDTMPNEKVFILEKKEKPSTHTKMKNSKPKKTERQSEGKREKKKLYASESEMNAWHYIKAGIDDILCLCWKVDGRLPSALAVSCVQTGWKMFVNSFASAMCVSLKVISMFRIKTKTDRYPATNTITILTIYVRNIIHKMYVWLGAFVLYNFHFTFHIYVEALVDNNINKKKM